MKRMFFGLVLIGWVGVAAAEMPPGAVLYFSCDQFQQNGTVLPDLATSNHNGRVSGVRYTTEGRLNGGCVFNGKNSRVDVAANPLLDTPRVSFCLWFKTSQAEKADRVLIDKQPGSGYGLCIAAGGGKKDGARKGKLVATVSGHECLSDSPVADNAWYHAAVTYDGSVVKLYVDGAIQKQTAAWSGSVAGSGQGLTLGMNRNSPTKEKDVAFDGTIDELVVFGRALSDAEVREVMSATRPKFTKQQVERRLRELKDLLDRGLILPDFYARKVKECDVSP